MIGSPSILLLSVRLKGIIEAFHQRTSSRHMIVPHVTGNHLIFMAVVTVLTSWRLD